jgi:hypothetical protein
MCPYKTTVAQLSRGDEAGRARAMQLLFESASIRSNCLIVLRVDPRIRVLREDARLAGRFGELLRDASVIARRVRAKMWTTDPNCHSSVKNAHETQPGSNVQRFLVTSSGAAANESTGIPHRA